MIDHSILDGINFLDRIQQKDGSFLSLSSQDPANFTKALTFHSVFSTSLILSCLSYIPKSPKLEKIKKKAASFLLSQKSEDWSFNYWKRGSVESQKMPYPDDLDDTFCALSAILLYNPKIIDGSSMAKIVTLLTLSEEKAGGPYRTWLVDDGADKAWKDIDLAVNSNIAYFLSLVGIDLPNITKLIESRVEQDNLTSSYYPTIYPVAYFISRLPKSLRTMSIKSILLSKKNKKDYWENPLNKALRICTLLNLGTADIHPYEGIKFLLKTQHNGSWEPYGFCLDPAIGNIVYYSGSSALTTALCLEALAKYQKALKEQPVGITNIDQKSNRIKNQILLQIRGQFSHLPIELRSQGERILAYVLKMDEKNQITLMPYFFHSALHKNGITIPDRLLISLGAANTFGWMAYTIYDNFLDEEGDPKSLSIANFALRQLTTIFYDLLPKNLKFQKLFHHIMDGIDGANTWEVTRCRFDPTKKGIYLNKLALPKFGNHEILAQKSLGHALGPSAILFLLGFNEKSYEVKHLLRFFTHYLIARQLNDDAHDWEEDFKKGHINPVIVDLLEKFLRNRKKGKFIKSSQLPTQLKELFWYETIADICSIILDNVNKAKESLNNISIIEDKDVLLNFLQGPRVSAEEALSQQKKAIDFINTYE